MLRDLVVMLSYIHVALYSILHGVSDAGSRLLFKFRSGTHGFDNLEIYAR